MSYSLPGLPDIAAPNLEDLETVRIRRRRNPNGVAIGYDFTVAMRLRTTAGDPVSFLGRSDFGVQASGESAAYPTPAIMAAAVLAEYAKIGLLENG